MALKLWLVRHAMPRVAPGVCYGRLDMPADADATRKAAAELAAVLPADLRLLTSPSLRCRQLTDALTALRNDLRPEVDPRLAEMDFGTWEGQRWEDIGKAAVDAWTRDFFHHAPGGGESLAGVMQRVNQALQAVQRHGHDTVWLTHAGVIRAASLAAKGVTSLHSASQWPVEVPAWGTSTVLEC